MKDARRYVAPFLIYLTLLLPTAPAGAYVLKSGHILQLMAQSLGQAKHLKVDQHLVVRDPLAEAGRIALPETLYYSFPLKFRADINSENLHRVHVAVGGATLTVMDRRITADTGDLFDRYKDLLLMRSRALLEKQLDAMGVNLAMSSLGRFNDTLALVVGAQYPDETVSQVWVDKATFRPLRWIFRTDGPLVRVFEIRYLQWQAIGEQWYPWQVEFYENQMLVRRIDVKKVTPEASLNRNIYNIAVLKQQFAAPTPDREPDAEKQVNEVQDTIDSFKKRFQQ